MCPRETVIKIRVLRVIARMNVGGPARQVVTLSRGLDPGRFDQRLVIGDVDDDEAETPEVKGGTLDYTRIPGLGRTPNPSHDVRAFMEIARLARAFRPDIVHTHTAKAGVLGRLAAPRGCATVHSFHGHLLHGYFSRPVTFAVTATERMLARRTTRLVAVGSQVRRELLERRVGRPEQYQVIPPGLAVAPLVSRDEARRGFGLAADAPVVAFVARLTKVKRPDRLLDALSLTRRSFPDVICLVAGDGELLNASKSEAARRGLDVRFLGWRSDIERVYAAADVVALTSDNEGMPVSLIEAALCERACVTTRVGSANEVVVDGETGFVVDTDVASLAAAMTTLLTDRQLRAAMGARARARAEARFGPSALVDATADLYEEVIRERLGGRIN